MNGLNRTRSLTARSIRRLIAGLGTMAMAFGLTALGLTGTGPADAATASASAVTVHPISLNKANFSGSAGFGSRTPAWYKDFAGVIHLQGAVTQTSTAGSTPDLIGTLPPAARPATNLFFIVHTFNGTYADVGIDTAGNISVINPRPPAVQDYTFLSLEGISYQLKPAADVATVGPDWAQFAGFDARVPASFKDKSGIVHLEGAAKQISTAGSTPNLIATLDPASRPSHTVYTVVHTFNGTYADLAIEPNGQIYVINPRPPAVQDYTFVSLEGITYHR